MLHNFRFFSTKCPVLHKVIFFVHKIFTFYINGAQRFKCPNSSQKGQPDVWTDWVQVKEKSAGLAELRRQDSNPELHYWKTCVPTAIPQRSIRQSGHEGPQGESQTDTACISYYRLILSVLGSSGKTCFSFMHS
jgi:hypothetical protein